MAKPKKIRCWVTAEEIASTGGEDYMEYYMWADEPEWISEKRWEGDSCIDVCATQLEEWLGKLPEANECIELEVKEGQTWLPPE